MGLLIVLLCYDWFPLEFDVYFFVAFVFNCVRLELVGMVVVWFG